MSNIRDTWSQIKSNLRSPRSGSYLHSPRSSHQLEVTGLSTDRVQVLGPIDEGSTIETRKIPRGKQERPVSEGLDRQRNLLRKRSIVQDAKAGNTELQRTVEELKAPKIKPSRQKEKGQSDLESKRRELEETIATLKSDMVDMDTASRALQNQNQLLQRQMKLRQQELVDSWVKARRLEESLTAHKCAIQNIKDEKEKQSYEERLEMERNGWRAREEDLENRIHNMNKQHDEIQNRLMLQISTLTQSNTHLSGELQVERDLLISAKLELNKTKNDLKEEQRRSAQAVEECAIKSQQLEFVQQECAMVQGKREELDILEGDLKRQADLEKMRNETVYRALEEDLKRQADENKTRNETTYKSLEENLRRQVDKDKKSNEALQKALDTQVAIKMGEIAVISRTLDAEITTTCRSLTKAAEKLRTDNLIWDGGESTRERSELGGIEYIQLEDPGEISS